MTAPRHPGAAAGPPESDEASGQAHQDAVRNAGILIVDDDPTNVVLLERILRKAGYTRLAGITDSRQVLAHVHETGPELILLDLHMPHLGSAHEKEKIVR